MWASPCLCHALTRLGCCRSKRIFENKRPDLSSHCAPGARHTFVTSRRVPQFWRNRSEQVFGFLPIHLSHVLVNLPALNSPGAYSRQASEVTRWQLARFAGREGAPTSRFHLSSKAIVYPAIFVEQFSLHPNFLHPFFSLASVSGDCCTSQLLGPASGTTCG